MTNTIINTRLQHLTTHTYVAGKVVYWMSRDHRVQDNWALYYAYELAKEHKVDMEVVFCLRATLTYTERLVDFMLGGLQEVSEELQILGIPFRFLLGDPVTEMFNISGDVGAIVTDFSPLHYSRKWKQQLSKQLRIPFIEVDTHNVVPCFFVSNKQEYGAYTLRPKIHKLLSKYVTPVPKITKVNFAKTAKVTSIDWDNIKDLLQIDTTVPKVSWITPGTSAGRKLLHHFVRHELNDYNEFKNDPNAFAISNMSPYLHFGHVSSAEVVREVLGADTHPKNTEAYIEEVVVRKELSDNYCYYNRNYNNPYGWPNWAVESLNTHIKDTREYSYSLSDLETASTHDILWNAAQMEMIKRGKMHGYLRMYWAKKILEWSKNATIAQQHAIYLNDKYLLDGRDPNGYTGIAWSIGGVHDRPWFERDIFGKVRYMNYNGAKKKFDVEAYISWVKSL